MVAASLPLDVYVRKMCGQKLQYPATFFPVSWMSCASCVAKLEKGCYRLKGGVCFDMSQHFFQRLHGHRAIRKEQDHLIGTLEIETFINPLL